MFSVLELMAISIFAILAIGLAVYCISAALMDRKSEREKEMIEKVSNAVIANYLPAIKETEVAVAKETLKMFIDELPKITEASMKALEDKFQ